VIWLRAVAATLTLTVFAGPYAGPPASAKTDAVPTIDRSVHVSFRHVDLTDGQRTLVIRVDASANARLVLASVDLTDRPSGGGVFISTDSPDYRLAYRPLRKVRGDARHGVWRARIRLDRHLPADVYHVSLHWKVGSASTDAWTGTGKTLTVTNAHSDTHPPVVIAQRRPLAGTAFSRSDEPRVSLHLRDRLAGVSLVWVCYYNVAYPDDLQCDEALKTSGTYHDGIWKTRLTRLHKLATGDVVLRLTTYDQVTLESDWVPADQIPLNGYARVIPGGRGHLTLTD
jgi:hypothetical protein